MGGKHSRRSDTDFSAPRRIGRRKFLIAAGGASALLVTPGALDAVALAHEPPKNVMLGEGEILLDAVTRGSQLWTLTQTPGGTILKTPVGEAPKFPTGFQAESLGRSGSRIIAGGHRSRPINQKFSEGNYAALVRTSGLPGLLSQPGLDNWPTEGTYEFQTNELVPAYVVLSDGVWSTPIDVPNLGDVAGSVTSVIGGANSLELVVDSLLDSSMRDSTTEVLQVTVSTQSGQSDRSLIADTVHGTSTVIGQGNNKAYVLATSLDGKQIVEVGSNSSETVELETAFTPLSVSVEDGSAELFVEGDNGEIGSIPLEEVSERSGDIEDHLQNEKIGKRSFGEDVVLAYEIDGTSP